MDFFARQERSQRATRYLVVLFALAFVVIATATAIGAGFVLGFLGNSTQVAVSLREPASFASGNIATMAWVAGGVLAIMFLASLYRSATLSAGGGQVARMLGATQVDPETNDPAHRRLLNVVEEMAIASGLPVPEVYVLDEEPAINAFAAGLTHADAAVCVTRGALERLDRPELQGVVAHEFSHILNGDMRLNQRLVGYSFGILVLTLAGRWMLRSQRFARRSRGNNSVALFGLALLVIGSIGVFFSRIIKAAVSRQREVLADASAVQFTREPSGLAGALKKIGGYTANFSKTECEEVSHMLFGPGAKSFRGMFATHPPIVERIRALEPGFDPSGFVTADEPLPAAQADQAAARGFVASSRGADNALERAGSIESPELGRAIRASMPEELQYAAHSRDSSTLLVIAMAVSTRQSATARQRDFLAQRLGRERAGRCLRLQQEIASLEVSQRLPLLEMTVPAVKARPAAQIEFLLDLVDDLIAVEGGDRLFDFVLVQVLHAYLAPVIGREPAPSRSASMMTGAAATELITTMAAFGHESEDVARAARAAGLEKLMPGREPAAPGQALMDLRERFPAAQLHRALARLSALSPRTRRTVLEAVIATMQHDRRLVTEEIELFRAVAAALHCPVPPLAAEPGGRPAAG